MIILVPRRFFAQIEKHLRSQFEAHAFAVVLEIFGADVLDDERFLSLGGGETRSSGTDESRAAHCDVGVDWNELLVWRVPTRIQRTFLSSVPSLSSSLVVINISSPMLEAL